MSIFILSIKADPLVFLDSSISSSSLENNKNRIGESGNPWGMPVFILTSWLTSPPATKQVVCPSIKPEYICIVVLRELLYTASLPELLAQFLTTVNAVAGGQSQLLPICT